MRKVTHRVCTAFVAGRACKVGNTKTDGQFLWLYGNLIAWRTPNGDISVGLAGWPTATTRERLNGLCELLNVQAWFGQFAGAQFFGNREIDPGAYFLLPIPEKAV